MYGFIVIEAYISHFAWVDQRLLQGNISCIALLRGQYLDIAREGGFQSSFEPPFDPTFDQLLKRIHQSFI